MSLQSIALTSDPKVGHPNSNPTKLAGVLVVEDEVLIRMDIADELSRAGFTVYEAADADQALRKLELHDDIVAVFSDVDMPGSMDGLVLAQVVRNHWPEVNTLLTSGHIRVGVDDLPPGGWFFSKPYDPAAVIGVLRDLSGR